MSNRISTMGFQLDASSQIMSLESATAKTQQQLSTGLRLQTASDDPAAASQVNVLNAQHSASEQYVTNQSAATSNLNLETTALTTTTSVLDNVKELSIEANNAAVSDADKSDIVSQLQQLLQQLVSLGNSSDTAGNYLFAGTASITKPFSLSGTTVTYNGSTQVNQIQISSNQSIRAGDSGAAVFMSQSSGNGTFTTAAGAANTGTGWIDPGTVTDAATWAANAGTYTITFTDASDYEVTDSGGNVVSNGTYTAPGPGTISFDGIQTTVTGAPVAGDTYTIAPSTTTSVFDTVANLIATLSSTTLTSAQVTTALGQAQTELDNAMTSLNNVQANVGARINAITTAGSDATSQQTSLATRISDLSGVDYAAATTQLSTEELALQAAEQSYASIQQLSLFKYLS